MVENSGEKVQTLTQTELMKERGWTKKLIEVYYPIPFATKKLYQHSTVMKLYSVKMVIEIENTPSFIEQHQKILAQRDKRKLASKKAVETKTQLLVELVNQISINVIFMKNKKLVSNAIEFYNMRQFNSGNSSAAATQKSNKEFLDRITVNYIRHNLTEYDCAIDTLYSRVGREKAFQLLRKKVFDAIAKAYPCYKAECDRQLTYRQQ